MSADLETRTNPSSGLLERIFKLSENKTTVKTEVLAGVTTFITLAYIIFVNPNILKDAGMNRDAAFVATAVASAFATLLMGFYANYPIALAPGMGLNAYFTYTVVMKLGLTWQAALGAVFISGVIFILLTITRIRQIIIDGVPQVLRLAIGVGIGLFIAFIGLKNAGVVVANPATFVSLGDMKSPGVLVTVFGLLFTGLLLARNVKGSLLIGMLSSTILAMFLGVTKVPASLGDIISFKVPSLAPSFLKLDIMAAVDYGLIAIIFAFTFVDMFDTVGTLIGVSRKGGLLDESGRLPRVGKAMFSDAVGTVAGSNLSTFQLSNLQTVVADSFWKEKREGRIHPSF